MAFFADRTSASLVGVSTLLLGLLLAAAPPSFVLEDQRQKKHDTRAVLGGDKPVVLLAGAERESGPAVQAWAKRLPISVKVYGIADLSDLPFFVPHAAVRSGLAEEVPATPVLLDFEGTTYTALGLPDGILSAGGAHRDEHAIVTGAALISWGYGSARHVVALWLLNLAFVDDSHQLHHHVLRIE